MKIGGVGGGRGGWRFGFLDDWKREANIWGKAKGALMRIYFADFLLWLLYCFVPKYFLNFA